MTLRAFFDGVQAGRIDAGKDFGRLGDARQPVMEHFGAEVLEVEHDVVALRTGAAAFARPELNMYSIARLISMSDRSAIPARAGMPPWPFNAACVTVASPLATRGVHAALSPIFGAPRSPVA